MSSEDYAYLTNVVQKIPGWLVDYTALRTMGMLDWQVQDGVKGPLLEIGVYHGRYLSLLLRSGKRTGERVVGLDTFQYVGEEHVASQMSSICGYQPVLIKKPSTLCTAGDLLVALGGKPRFISVDGSHDYEDVFWDLLLSEQILSENGIVAVDDFLNPVTLGVNEAVNAFFATPRGLAPFAYIANKIFFCRPPAAKNMMDRLEAQIRADTVEPRSKTFVETSAQGRHMVEQRMWRRSFLVVP